ncbi:hypothetical protein Fmac_015530 [Flemingia macrophylla]|uniref:Cyclic nucleotide-binding domain-containing protein n=1 Tax=Flemingia macrophylla TaxID=520843 RepID=A0ABD1MEU3_9FABA
MPDGDENEDRNYIPDRYMDGDEYEFYKRIHPAPLSSLNINYNVEMGTWQGGYMFDDISPQIHRTTANTLRNEYDKVKLKNFQRDMADFENDKLPMLSDKYAPRYDEREPLDSKFRRIITRTQSASISIPMSSLESYEKETSHVGHTGPLQSKRNTPFMQMSGPLYATTGSENLLQKRVVVSGNKGEETKTENFGAFRDTGSNLWNNDYDRKNEHLLRSGQLGMCNDPYCTTCPTYFNASQQRNRKPSTRWDPKFHNALYGDAKSFVRKLLSFCSSYVPGVMNPHAKVVQRWNQFLAIFCLIAIFVDPLFFFLLYVEKDNKCIVINWPLSKALVSFRSVNDFLYFLNILLQFRLAYVSRESRVVGAGDLVDHPKKIALHYLKGYFLIDLFVVFPLPQIMILFVLPNSLGGANYAKNLLRAGILVQYIPKLFRFLPLLIGQSPTGFIFESAWANFIINLLIFMLASHVVGSCWYLFGLQRVNQCLRDACHGSNIIGCMKFIDCGRGFGNNQPSSYKWINNSDAVACLDPSPDGFAYGIYLNAVPLTSETNIVNKYVYSLFWGFLQISTLAGNLEPSYFVWEVLFTMAIIGMGLLLFAILIGNIQNFLQALGRRKLEMQLRGRDVEQWMSHRRLPEDLRRRVRQAERYNWAATRGVNEEMLMENLPEDLQRDIRRHLFKFVKNIRIFALMDEPILDSICERLRQKTYIKGCRILSQLGLVEKMVFVVRGKLESIGEDGTIIPLSEGDVCGEELLTWYLEHSSVSTDGRKVRLPGQRLVSNRTVRCLTNVEAFSLSASDLEEVTILFTRFLRSPCVQGALREISQEEVKKDQMKWSCASLEFAECNLEWHSRSRNVLYLLDAQKLFMVENGQSSRCDIWVITWSCKHLRGEYLQSLDTWITDYKGALNVDTIFSLKAFTLLTDSGWAGQYESPYWRSLAANRIQVAWRYRKKRLSRLNSAASDYS